MTHVAVLAHRDAIERKPFYHYLPGKRVLTLAAPGCSFHCRFCLNHRLSQVPSAGVRSQVPSADVRPCAGSGPEAGPEGGPSETAAGFGMAEVVAQAAQLDGLLGWSYTEPTLSAEALLDAVAAAAVARLGVRIVWKTNGFITKAALGMVMPHLSAVNLDLKAADDETHKRLTGGAGLGPVLATLDALAASGVWLEVTTPLIPGVNSDENALRLMARSIAARGRQIPWHLRRFFPAHHLRDIRPNAAAELQRALEIARAEGLAYVYVERGLGAPGRNTWCPICAAELVARGIGTTEVNRLVDGCCPSCGTAIPGRWTP